MAYPLLFIDDDANLLKSFRRSLAGHFNVHVAEDPVKGLRMLSEAGPFPVVVSDMKMPKMSGIEVLSKAQDISPDTVRILLTGCADQQTAIDAVNKGEVFRFLTKPCSTENLIDVLKGAVRQYQLIVSEKQLLEQTLLGTINVLSQIVSLINPVAQGKANRLKQYARHVATAIAFEEEWLVEMAAILSQLGCLTIPQEVVSRHMAGGPLDENEQKMIDDHPALAVRLLSRIPRLEDVLEVVSLQNKPLDVLNSNDGPAMSPEVLQAAKILQAVVMLDSLLMSGFAPMQALEQLEELQPGMDQNILEALVNYDFGLKNMIRVRVCAKELNTQMIIDEDVHTNNGVLLAAKGQLVRPPLVSGLQNFAKTVGLQEPFFVLVPINDYK